MSKTTTTTAKLKRWATNHPDILLCILFGSIADETAEKHSDTDIAVAARKSLTATQKQILIEELATISGRPVDLTDLHTTSGTLLHQVLTKGKLLKCSDHLLYAEIMKRMLFNQSDMMPYNRRILKERREQWINE